MKQHLDSRPMPFPNLTAALRHWAVTTPDSLALAAGDSELTYAELSERVDRCAAWLTEQGYRRANASSSSATTVSPGWSTTLLS